MTFRLQDPMDLIEVLFVEIERLQQVVEEGAAEILDLSGLLEQAKEEKSYLAKQVEILQFENERFKQTQGERETERSRLVGFLGKILSEKSDLAAQVKRLQSENEELKQAKVKVETEFSEYKNLHPANVGVKHGKPFAIIANNQSKKKKKPGARKGHKPWNRPLPENFDKIVPVPIEQCPHCGSNALSEVQEIRERIIEDIPVSQPIVKKYQIERKYCRCCKKIVEVQVPDALPKARLGLRLMLMVMWLKIGLRLTEEAIPQILMQSYGFKMSEGEVISILKRLAKEFGPYYNALLDEIKNVPSRNMDETSWRIDGENSWMWIFITKGLALYRISHSRGHEVPLKVLGKHPKGVNGHDRFSAYGTLAAKTGNPLQQYCWAHILKDAKELEQYYGEEGALIKRVLKKVFDKAKSFDHKGTEADVNMLHHMLRVNLDRKYTSSRCWKYITNLLKGAKHLFTFVTNPDVEPTNNLAERGIRHAVIARKISGGSRSEQGARMYETLLSVTQTMKLKGQNLLNEGAAFLRPSFQ